MRVERAKISRATWESLKTHILRERKLKRDLAEANEERIGKVEMLEKCRQKHASSLQATNEQIEQAEKRLQQLKDEKHEMFLKLRKVLNEDEVRRRQNSHVLLMPCTGAQTSANMPQPLNAVSIAQTSFIGTHGIYNPASTFTVSAMTRPSYATNLSEHQLSHAQPPFNNISEVHGSISTTFGPLGFSTTTSRGLVSQNQLKSYYPVALQLSNKRARSPSPTGNQSTYALDSSLSVHSQYDHSQPIMLSSHTISAPSVVRNRNQYAGQSAPPSQHSIISVRSLPSSGSSSAFETLNHTGVSGQSDSTMPANYVIDVSRRHAVQQIPLAAHQQPSTIPKFY